MRYLWLVVLLAVACSSSTNPTFSLTSATVDATYRCPGGASNAPYSIHGTVQARNETGSDVTVDSATAELVLQSVQGAWLEKVGARYDAGKIAVTPTTIAARSSQALDVIIPSACTSGASGSSPASSGSYDVRVTLVTSAGRFAVTAKNRHEILAA